MHPIFLCFLYFLLNFIDGKVIGESRSDNDFSNENQDLSGLKNFGNSGKDWNKIFVDAYGCPQSTDYICNLHNPEYNCTCYRPNQLNPLQYPSCDEVFYIQNVRAYVVELRTKLPQNENFINKFDIFIAELIEDFCAIDRKYLVILRKRCAAGDMLIQIAFLRATDKPLPTKIGISELQAVHPSIFTQNKEFMKQPYLPILNVSEVDFLTPVVRQPGEPIIHGKRYNPEKSDTFLSTLFEIGYIAFFALILLIANLIPICLLWKIICDRRTKDSNQFPVQMSHLQKN